MGGQAGSNEGRKPRKRTGRGEGWAGEKQQTNMIDQEGEAGRDGGREARKKGRVGGVRQREGALRVRGAEQRGRQAKRVGSEEKGREEGGMG